MTAPIKSISLAGSRYCYSDPRSLSALAESVVADIYDSREIKAGDTVLDLGAGIGEFTVAASRRAGPEGHVLAVEPDSRSYSYLVTNLRANGCTNVVAHNVAAGDGTIRLSSMAGGSVRLPTLRLSEILGTSTPDVVKMDVEGAEVPIVESGIELISHARFISIELHGIVEPIQRALGEAGYRFLPVSRPLIYGRVAKFALIHPLDFSNLIRVYSSVLHGDVTRILFKGPDITKGSPLLVGKFVRPRSVD